jgi:hypothetical protein
MKMNENIFIKIVLVLILLCGLSHAGGIDIDKEIDSYLREREIANVSEIKVIDNVIDGAFIIKIWADNSLYVKAIQYKSKKRGNESFDPTDFHQAPFGPYGDRDTEAVSSCRIIENKINDMDKNDYTFEELADELIENCLHEDSFLYESLVSGLIGEMTELEHWPIVINLIRTGVAKRDETVLNVEFDQLAQFVMNYPVLIPEYKDLKTEFSKNIYQ